ncbi:MAG TPA: GNAT family N-acetyltransferase [Thermotogota bacterium]|nr:GNAT family N-acetyltransferase [Thermotogota bacterium]HPR95149.1 GNAT family N-acetyltransferase [Thermotogota bacterium]
MKELVCRELSDVTISILEDLCNALMKFQAQHAVIKPEFMASMNFNNRFVPDYSGADRKYIVAAYDEDTPVGFAFATAGEIVESDLVSKPAWAEDLTGKGFYPDGYTTPKMIGTYKLLYVDPEYRGCKAGGKLSDMIMKWLKAQTDVEDLWVYVANGN